MNSRKNTKIIRYFFYEEHPNMNSIFKITPFNNTLLQGYKEKAMAELNDFFGRKWVYNTPKVFVVDDRETINLLQEKETENWVVGFSTGVYICILNPDNISKESCHDGSTYKVEKLIKHELCHIFFNKSFGGTNFPWITEGMSIYVADQFYKYPIPEMFNGFLDGKKIYQESGASIKLLIDNFGKDKVFEFLRKQNGVKDIESLNSIFKEVFGSKMEYSFFNNLH
ncbi:MAG: hypothetical protein UU80_C0005G0009 [candidate division WWE3 bacterium GW2011_GWA1_41_8]|uniref:Peptidase MA-like domain-containing protein n=3 Tax=Katanobacteria TaxID=422282 RepID=A0A0G0XC83_UNCKA|nr:MAG: hypothetical protein UU80_C0005G0009 [candidate division WWE3 bacterium GW2011_GWA1_41_8]